MTERKQSGADRAEIARRHDDSELIDAMEDAPAFGGSAGGNLQRDIGSRDEINEEVGDGDGVTRVRDSDKPEQADLPRYNQK
ncbi:MAG: hypothetical protein QOH81_1949 [Sphingomonadales bacterium]|jgi:hypothetical protein|nr:hypothetical protein [Sphingomonadales bacterium]